MKWLFIFDGRSPKVMTGIERIFDNAKAEHSGCLDSIKNLRIGSFCPSESIN